MQKVAFHMKHFKRQELAAVGAEGQRETGKSIDNRIDFSLSVNNFQAGTGQPMDKKSYPEEVRKLLEGYGVTRTRKGKRAVFVYRDGKTIRADANFLTGIVLTLDKDTVKAWGEKNARNYFKAAAAFLKKEFGNCIDDVVHVDEPGAGWHLHFYGVSLKTDEKGITRLNTRDRWKRGDLKKLHTELTKYLQQYKFPVERGQENSGIVYEKSYKDAKRNRSARLARIENIESHVKKVEEAAEHKEASGGVLGIGRKPERVELPLENYNELVELAKGAAEALEELEENKRRMDQSRKLQEANRREAKAQEDRERMAAELEAVKQEAAEKAAAMERDQQEKIEKAQREAVALFKQNNKRILQSGLFLEPVARYADLVEKVNEIGKEARRRQQERAAAKSRNTARDSSRGDGWEM